jgi:hypothetical protein
MLRFIGCSEQLQRFRALREQTRGGILHITGGPGVGKTRLLQELAERYESGRTPNLLIAADDELPTRAAGLLTGSGRGFRLHEEVRDLLGAYARGHGLDRSTEARELHAALAELLRERHGAEQPGLWYLDAARHLVPADSRLSERGIDPEEFRGLLGGSVSLRFEQKFQIAGKLPELETGQIEALIGIFEEEIEKYKELWGDSTAEIFDAAREGRLLDTLDVEYWRERTEHLEFRTHRLALEALTPEQRRRSLCLLDSFEGRLERALSRQRGAVDIPVSTVQPGNPYQNSSLGGLSRNPVRHSPRSLQENLRPPDLEKPPFF